MLCPLPVHLLDKISYLILECGPTSRLFQGRRDPKSVRLPVLTIPGSGYLQPNYGDLWAPGRENIFLQQAEREMVISVARPGIETRHSDGDETEIDEGKPDDGESDVKARAPESGMGFL